MWGATYNRDATYIRDFCENCRIWDFLENVWPPVKRQDAMRRVQCVKVTGGMACELIVRRPNFRFVTVLWPSDGRRCDQE